MHDWLCFIHSLLFAQGDQTVLLMMLLSLEFWIGFQVAQEPRAFWKRLAYKLFSCYWHMVFRWLFLSSLSVFKFIKYTLPCNFLSIYIFMDDTSFFISTNFLTFIKLRLFCCYHPKILKESWIPRKRLEKALLWKYARVWSVLFRVWKEQTSKFFLKFSVQEVLMFMICNLSNNPIKEHIEMNEFSAW